jgi:hypothetical protein
MNLALLAYEMRAAGIKSLALELSDDSGPPAIASPDDRATLAPDADPAFVEPEFRGDPNQCAMEGCGEPNGGVLGGKLKQFCRKHAFQRLGVK